MKRLDPPRWVQKMTNRPFLCYHDSDTSIFSVLALLSLLCCSWIPPPPLPPVSQRTQLIKTDKQAHLDPSEAAAGCIISPDKEKGGLGISDIVILLGRLRGNHRELGGLYSRGTNAAQESCRIHIFNLRIEMKLKVSLTALQFPLPFLLILVHSHFHQQLFSPPQKKFPDKPQRHC